MILVVGATGRLGGTIARRLLADGRNVRVLVREGSDYQALIDAGAEAVIADLKAAPSLTAACRGIQAIVTTANAAGRGGTDTFETVDDQGNRNLVEAAVAAGVDRFIFVSALGADPSNPFPLLRAKGLTEGRLRASGMQFTILQPDVYMDLSIPIVLGTALATDTPVPLVLDGRRTHSFVALADVAAFATAVLDRNDAHGQTIVVGGPEALSWRDILGVAEQVLDRSIPSETVEPGQSVLGLPPFVIDLLTFLEMYDSSADAREAAMTYGVELTSIRRWMTVFLGTLSLTPVR